MINVYRFVEDIECTEYWKASEELKERTKEAVNDFLEKTTLEYQWLSDEYVAFEDEDIAGELEEELERVLEEVYDTLIEELEEEEEEEDEEF